MLFCLITLLTLTLCYNITAIVINKGIPESISDTAYIYNNHCGKYYLFTIYCLLTSVLLFPVWITLSMESIQCLCFLSCSGIIFAGVTPFFKESYQKTLHYTSGILAMVSYILWVCLSGYWCLLGIQLCAIVLLVLFDRKNYVFYSEIVGILGMIGALCM